MKSVLHALILLLAWVALLRPGSAQAQVVGDGFSCDGTFYQTRQQGTGATAYSVLYRVDRSTATYTTRPFAGGSFGTTGTINISGTNLVVNALAYNSQNGYLYAVTYPADNGTPSATPHIYQIGQSGVQDLGATNLPTYSYASGTFDKKGNYYLTGREGGAQGTVYRITVATNPLAATALTLRNSGNTANTTAVIYDLGYNPIDNSLYGVYTDNYLAKLSFPTGVPLSTDTYLATTFIGSTTNSSQIIGSCFFDISGRLYAYSNGTVGTAGSGRFYIINLSTGAYTQLSSIDPVSSSDGASCINPLQRLDVTKDVTNVVGINATTFDVSYAIRVRNTGTIIDSLVQVSDFLRGTTAATSANTAFPTSTSATITAGSLKVANLDGSSLAVNPNFNGTTGNASLLTGTQLLQPSQRAVITYTVRLVFPANNVPTGAQNNTAYATVTSSRSNSTSNNGYTQSTVDGTLLPPADLQANDASTNSADFASLRSDPNDTGDTASPTPVIFLPSISGTVFEDVNYGGGVGRDQGTSNGIGRPGARVELYTVSAAGVASYNSFTTSLANGSYSFNNLTAGSSYVVRVLSNSVTSSRNTGAATGLVGVQTYRTSVTSAGGTTPDPSRVGGEYPKLVEAGNGTTTAGIGTVLTTLNTTTAAAESISNITLSSFNAPAVDVNFGYNFDTVVNTNDTGQGSLRQFITNANALDNTTLVQEAASSTGAPTPATGVETSIFMVPDGNVHDGLTAYNATSNPGLASQLTNGVAVITPATALPAIGGTYGAFTSLDGTTQTQNVGNTNSATPGAGVMVGTMATSLSKVNGPEVQLTGTSSIAFGLDVANTGANTTVKGLSIYDFGNAQDSNNGANIRSNAANLTISQNLIGSAALAFTAPSTLTNADNIRIVGGTGLSITNNLIGYSNSKGIAIGPGVTGSSITNNEIRSNGQAAAYYDGIDIQGSQASVSGNLFINNGGQGIDSYNSNGGNTLANNTVTGNGGGTSNTATQETPGIRIYGPGNVVSQNVISNNYGAGVLLVNTASTTKISQNSIFGNGSAASGNGTAASGEIGIDLEASTDDVSRGTSPYVTLNNSVTTGTNANGLLNYPILTSATVVGTNLLVQGYAKAGATIELFTAQANSASLNATGANFGQGKTYLTTVTEGSSADMNTLTGQSYGPTTNGFAQGSDTNANGFSFLIPLSSLPAGSLTNGSLAAGTVLTSTATLNSTTSEFSGNVASTVTAPLTGYVYEDVNYGGGLGRARSATGAATRPGAKVELYDNTGAYVSTAITDANGQYSFAAIPGSYTVRVVNNSVLSSRGQAAATYSGDATVGYTNTLLPVQTYNGTTDRVGGENPKFTDALANTGTQTLASLSTGTVTPESIAAVTVAQAAATNAGADFGFNFDTVVNTNDVAVSGNNTQGSLRQFILNSNALGTESALRQVYTNAAGTTTALATGLETSIFMVPGGTAVAGQRATVASSLTASNNGTGTAATITLTSALPAITGPNTAIDGTTQTRSTGDTNALVTTAGSESTGPEVIINDNSQGALTFSANNDQLLGLGIYNSLNTQGVFISNGVTGTTIANNTIYNNGANITFDNNAGSSTVTNNVIRDSQRGRADGIELNGANKALTITGNQLLRNGGYGIDFIGGNSTNNTISGNTFTGNGVKSTDQMSGIGLRGSGSNNNVISNNAFIANRGAGIIAREGTTGNTFSQNTFYGNGTANNTGFGLAIDLVASGTTTATPDNGDGVTLNDNGDTAAGANGLLNFPIITLATVVGTNLVVQGYARPNSIIEFYNPGAVADPTGFGEGQAYLGTYTEGSSADTNTGTGTYGPAAINGLLQGTDNTNRFTFTIPLTGSFAGYTAGSLLSSTATLNGNTSEFSGNVKVNLAPTANNVTNVAVLTTSTATVLNPNLAATPNGAGVTIASYTITDLTNINGTLAYNGTTLTSSNIATTVITDLTKLTYKPTLGFSGNATFSYNATDSNGTLSNTATYTIPVSPVADVVAAFPTSNPTSATASSGLTLTVNFTNAGANTAAGVTRSVQLPAGLGTVTATNGTYNNTTGLVTFTPSPTTLATTDNLNATITISSVPVGMTSVTAVAVIATTTSENGVTANNTATITVPVAPSFDLATTLNGPTTLVDGTIGTYTITTRNNGPSAIGLPAEGTTAATGAVQTVQLPTGLSGVFATNGGQYNSSTGIVTFPDVALASGQVVTNTVSFSIATGVLTFTPRAVVAKTSTLTGTDTNSANDTAYLNGSTSSAPATTTTSAPTGTTPATTANLYVTATGPAVVAGGAVATYTITQGNSGPLAASGVQTQVSLPTGQTVAGLSLTLNGTTATGTLSNGVITFNNGGATYTQATGLLVLPALTAAQASAATPQTYTIGITAPTTTLSSSLSVTASVGATTSDIVPANNVASVTTEIQPLTDVTIALVNTSLNMIAANGTVGAALGNGNFLAGQPASFEIQAINNSTNLARSVQQTVTLPVSLDGTTLRLNGVAGTLSNGVFTFTGGATYTVATGALSLPTIADLMGGAVQTTLLSFTVPSTNTSGILALPLAAAISTSTPESNSANNAASLSPKVNSAQDVAVSLAGPAQAVVGNPVLYTVSTVNNGPSANGTQTTTVTLPTALDPTTLLVNNAASTSNSSGVYTFLYPSSTTVLATYTVSTGALAFTASGLAMPKAGLSTVNTFQFVAPDVTLLNAVANVTTSGTDLNLANNSAQVITPLSASNLASLDLATTLTSTGSLTTGGSRTYSVTTTNSSTTTTATGVTQTLVLPAGLTSNGGSVTTTNGGVYNNQTGVVTFAVGTVGTTAVTNSATFLLPASSSGSDASGYSLVVTGSSFTANPETNLTNNTVLDTRTIGAKFDLATTISGPAAAPAGATVTYSVAYANNGPSQAAGVSGTITLPTGVAYSITDNLGNTTTGTSSGSPVTVRASGTMLAGVTELYSISFAAPTSTFTASANIATSGSVAESNVAPNSASVTTIVNQAPVAYDVVNKAQSPEGNTAGALTLTPLNAADTDGGTIASYTITSIPNAATQGTLYLGTTAVTVGQVLTASSAGAPPTLTFDPVASFVGSAFFTYTATDNGNGTAAYALTSAPARYTIQVGQDNNSFYTATPAKGGSAKYATNDVLAYAIDPNGSAYTSGGIVYNATTGALQSGAANGLALSGTNAVLATSGNGPTGNTANTLPTGVSLDPVTGLIYVSNASLLPKITQATTYTVNVITTDVNGGTNTITATFTIGAYPLPVELTAFTAQAVSNRDALLNWATASELNSAYFDVERSLDGTTFAKIGQVAAQGTKLTATAYSLTDAGIGPKVSGPVYYRLRQVDQDGTATYSAAKVVSFTKATTVALSLYPNPAQTTTTLDLSALPASASYQVLLLDATGRQVLAATLAGGAPQLLDVTGLASGTYNVLVTGTQPDGSALRQVIRLTKE